MESRVNEYLDKVSANLCLPECDKSDVIGEIRNHIHEAVNSREPLESVLAKLGEPRKLAKSYSDSYHLSNDQFRLTDILGSIAFYSSVALSGVFVVTVLPVISVSFVLTSIFVLGVAVTNFIGLTNLPFNLGFTPVTGVPQILLAVLVSAVLLFVARYSWIGLKKYLKSVSSNYHKRRVK